MEKLNVFLSQDGKTALVTAEGYEPQVFRLITGLQRGDSISFAAPVAAGGGIPQNGSRSKKAKAVKASKQPRRCKVCGEIGHDIRKCPKAASVDKADEPKVAEPEMSEDELREQIQAYREEGKDSLWIAAKLRIKLKRIQELWD